MKISQSSIFETKKILIVEDHSATITGLVKYIKDLYREPKIFTAKAANEALKIINENQNLQLAILDIVIPNISKEKGGIESKEHGLDLIKELMEYYPSLNILIHTNDMLYLLEILPQIESHDGGLVIAPKTLTDSQMLERINIAIYGGTYTQEFRRENKIKPSLRANWYKVIQLAYQEAFEDPKIAEEMGIKPVSVRRIWSRIYDVLELEKEPGINRRIATYNKLMKMNYLKPPK